MTTIHILKEARELLSDPQRWTQKVYARNEGGSSTREIQKAVCWCPLGALAKVGGMNTPLDAGIILYDAQLRLAATTLRSAMGGNIALFNDRRSHAAVLRAFDNAIQMMEAI